MGGPLLADRQAQEGCGNVVGRHIANGHARRLQDGMGHGTRTPADGIGMTEQGDDRQAARRGDVHGPAIAADEGVAGGRGFDRVAQGGGRPEDGRNRVAEQGGKFFRLLIVAVVPPCVCQARGPEDDEMQGRVCGFQLAERG